MGDQDAHRPRPRPRNWPASSIDRDQAWASMAPDDTCPDCAGAGYYTLAVPIGHVDFGKLLPCACCMRAREQRAQEQAAQHTQALLAELARTLGRLVHARFDTFDLNRTLVELMWGGATFPVDVQRQARRRWKMRSAMPSSPLAGCTCAGRTARTSAGKNTSDDPTRAHLWTSSCSTVSLVESTAWQYDAWCFMTPAQHHAILGSNRPNAHAGAITHRVGIVV